MWHVHQCGVCCVGMRGWTSACSQYIYEASERTINAMQRSVHVLAEFRRMPAVCNGHAKYAEKGK